MAEKFRSRKITFHKGSTLLEEGRTGSDAYLITKGKVEIRKGVCSSNPLVLGNRSRGEIIGEMALFDGQPHMASAVALEETEVAVLPRDEFIRQVNAMHPVVRGAVMLMVQRARDMANDLMSKNTDVNWNSWETFE